MVFDVKLGGAVNEHKKSVDKRIKCARSAHVDSSLYTNETPGNQVLERKTGISAIGGTSKIGVFSELDFGMRFCELWGLDSSGLGVVLEAKIKTKSV